MAAAPKPLERRPGFANRGYTFGTGGAMPPVPPGSPMGGPPPGVGGPPPGPPGPPGAPPGPPGAGGDPAQALRQQIANAPPKARAKVAKIIKTKLAEAIKAKLNAASGIGGGATPPLGAGAPPPQPSGMKHGGKVVKKAAGGSVRGVGIARKGGGRGRIC